MNEEEEQQSSNGGTHSAIRTLMPWTSGALGHEPLSRTKKNDREFKADFASVAIKRDTSPDTVQTKEQEPWKHPHPTPLSLLSRQTDRSAQPKRHKRSLPPSMQKLKKSMTASPTNYSAKRIFSMPEPGSLGKGTLN